MSSIGAWVRVRVRVKKCHHRLLWSLSLSLSLSLTVARRVRQKALAARARFRPSRHHHGGALDVGGVCGGQLLQHHGHLPVRVCGRRLVHELAVLLRSRHLAVVAARVRGQAQRARAALEAYLKPTLRPPGRALATGFGFRFWFSAHQIGERRRGSPPHRPRGDGLAHPADTPITNLASVLGLLSSQDGERVHW
jgi:hypothetical protein